MASLADYLRQRENEADPEMESLARALSTYTSNQDVIEALGGRDRSIPGVGLGKRLLTSIGAPGRLVTAGILEAIGSPTPELQQTSGLEQVGKLLRGDINVGFGQVGPLQTKPGEGVLPRAAKLAGAFALDVAADPISYIAAPASISRKAAAELAVRTAPKLLDDLVKFGSKGEGVLDELAALSPKKRAAQIQEGLKLTADPGTPAQVLATQGRRAIAEQELGNAVGEALIRGGRREVMRVLEKYSGSKSAALSLFKKLPEEVRGGIVVAGITGKPLRNAAGEYVRITQGTGAATGPLGDLANRLRLNASAATAGVRAPFSGRVGDIYAGVTRGILKEAREGVEFAVGRDRLIDAFQVRDGLGFRNFTRTQLEGRALAAAAQATALLKPYRGSADEQTFMEAYKLGMFSPQASTAQAASKAELDGRSAATLIRKEIENLFQEAKRAGVEINRLGGVESWSPLMLTDKAYERLSKLGLAKRADNPYRSTEGRRSFVEYRIEDDPEMLSLIGFTDETNPGVVYLNAIEANKVLADRARKLGLSEKEIQDAAETFIEDPTLVMQRYGNYVANVVANRKFLQRLVNAGTVLQDVPSVRRMLNQKVAATFVGSLQNLSPELKKFAADSTREADEALSQLLEPRKLDDLMSKIAQFRRDASNVVTEAKQRESMAIEAYDRASEAVDMALPQAGDIRTRLVNFEAQAVENAANIRQADLMARRQRSEIKKAQQQVGAVQQSWAEPAGLDEVFDIMDVPAARAQVDAARNAKEQALQEMAAARATRNTAREEEIAVQLSTLEQYEKALSLRNAALEQVQAARQVRSSAVDNLRKANEQLELEQITSVEAVVSGYMESKSRVTALRNRIADTVDPQERLLLTEQLGNLVDAAKAHRKVIRELFAANVKRFDGAASEYGKALIAAADKLSAEQMQSLKVLSSEREIQKFIQTYLEGGRDQVEVLAAMGDMYKTFASIRDILPDSVFSTLESSQKKLLEKGNFGSLLGRLFREEKAASELAEKLVDGGYASVAMGRGTDELFAASGVLKTMRRIYETEQNPEGWQKFIADVFDPFLSLWKSSVTIGRGPGYTARNVSGGVWMNYLGNVSIEDHKLVFSALTRIRQTLAKEQKLNPNKSYYDNLLSAESKVIPELNKTKVADMGLGDLMQQLFLRGAFYDTEMSYAAQQVARFGSSSPAEAFQRGEPLRRFYTTEASGRVEQGFRSSVDFLMTNQVYRFFSDMAQTSEMFLRGAAFIDGYRRYKNLGAAMDKVHLLHFNYQDLGPGDMWVKRIMPFYVWSRNNIPAQLRAMFMQPGKMQKAFQFNEEFQRTFGADGDDSWLNQVVPEYMQIANGFVSNFEFADNNIGLMMNLPTVDIDRLLSGDGFPLRGRELGAMFGPFTAPLELITQTSLGGVPFREGGEEVPAYYNIFRGIPYSGIRTDSEGKTTAAPALARGLGELLPQLGLAERVASFVPGVNQLLSTESQRQRGLTNFLNLTGITSLGGYTTTTITPKTTRGELIRRGGRQSSTIKQLVDEMGVDIDWVREQLRNGRTPEEVRQLLEYGYGKAEETQASTMKPETRRRYLDIISGLNA